jgi:hypothetical protein
VPSTIGGLAQPGCTGAQVLTIKPSGGGGRRRRLKEFLLNKDYYNNDDCTCVFMHKSSASFCIILVYADDLNFIGTELDINKARDHFKMEFEMKNLVKTKFS